MGILWLVLYLVAWRRLLYITNLNLEVIALVTLLIFLLMILRNGV